MNRSRGTLLVFIAVLVVLSALLVLPYLQYVLAAVLLAFVLTPLQRRLEERVSPTIAAFALVILALLGFILPVLVVIAVVAQDALRVFEETDPDAFPPEPLESLAERFGIDLEAAILDSARDVGAMAAERSLDVVTGVTHIMIGIGLALFLLYYFLKDGDNLLAWLQTVTPVPESVQQELFDELEDVTWAVLAGHVLIAIVEGTIAGIALFVTGIPNALFWTMVMIVLSLIPLIGAFLVWGPAAVYLLLIGEPVLAVGLAVYSAIVVGIADDYLRPIVVDRYADLNPAVIIVGVLGGVTAFGLMGLFFGPVLLGALVATLSIFDEHYDDL
ncbi:AI-2E family transporter [Natrialbaceae archaeon A-CW3]